MKTSIIFQVLLLTVTIILSSCDSSQEQVKPLTKLNSVDEISVYPTEINTDAISTTGRTQASKKFGSVSAWMNRDENATGRLRLALYRAADKKRLAISGWLDVQILRLTSEGQTHVKFRLKDQDGNGFIDITNEQYVIEVILSDDASFEANTNTRIYWLWTAGPEDVYPAGNGGFRNLQTDEWGQHHPNSNLDFKFRNTVIENGVESVDQIISVTGRPGFVINGNMEFTTQMYFTGLSD